eukprot:940731-Prymnesium_polylepis.1
MYRYYPASPRARSHRRARGARSPARRTGFPRARGAPARSGLRRAACAERGNPVELPRVATSRAASPGHARTPLAPNPACRGARRALFCCRSAI